MSAESKSIRVFVSGAMASHELDDDREVTRSAINAFSPEFCAFAYSTFGDEHVPRPSDFKGLFDSGRHAIAESQALALLVGRKISSFCIDEFKVARELGMPCAVLAKNVENRDAKAARFLRDCRCPVLTYTSPTLDLVEMVTQFCDSLRVEQDVQRIALVDTGALWRGIVAGLLDRPDSVFELSPRRFEELIAELVEKFGYEVELTPQSRDGGRDIIAVRTCDLIFPDRHLIEAKLWTPPRRVGRPVIDAIYGVGMRERCNGVMVVTPSGFSRDASKSVSAYDLHQYVRLVDGDELPCWYQQYLLRLEKGAVRECE